MGQPTELYAAAHGLLERLHVVDKLQERAELPFPGDVWRAVADADWFRILVPEEQGGLGLTISDLGAVFRAVGRRLFVGPLAEHAINVPVLLAGRGELLEECLAGRTIVVVAQQQPAPYAGEPVRMRDGHLNGDVDLVPYAQYADQIAIVAETPDGPCVVLVPADRCAIEPVVSQDPCIAFGRVTLDGVAVTPDQVLCSGAEAERALARMLAIGRLTLAAELAGVCAELTDLAVAYAKTREQFGRPIGGFQAIRHLLAEMAGRVASLESLVEVSLTDADAADDKALALLGLTAKIHASTVARAVAHQSLQVHGAIGFTTELPMHLYYWRAMSGQGRFGEADTLAVELGSQLLAVSAA
jgi:alkylation response protein AidB-like acyl-CoA dehydrogenase